MNIANFRELLELDAESVPTYIPEKVTKNVCPWIEKYRPMKLRHVVYQTEIVKILQKTLETGNLPHLLLYGPPGTGKTSTILAVARELFGPKVYRDRVIELNASDERGINVVRNKIVQFAKIAIGPRDPNYLCPDYKIIILDEADAMTTEAQSALRKTMETNSNITRFCFICNYINQIIEPINSRCAKFRFKPLDFDNMKERLEKIATNETLKISPKFLDIIINSSNGDLRKAIMLLQNVKYLTDVNEAEVYKLCGKISDNVMDKIVEICVDNNTKLETIVNLTRQIKGLSYPIQNILDQLCIKIVNSVYFTDLEKCNICETISESERMLMNGGDEYIQILNIFVEIHENRHKN